MKKCFFSILLMIFSVSIYAQSGWIEYLTPADTLNSFDIYDLNTGFAVGHNGNLIKTINGGINWSNINSISPLTNLLEVKILNNVLLIITSDSVLRSTNGGLTLTPVYNFPHSSYASIKFINNTTGYAIVSGQSNSIIKTNNSGVNWQTFSQYNDFYYDISSIGISLLYTSYSISFYIPGGGTGYQTGISKSTNSGNNWNYTIGYLSSSNPTFQKPVFFIDSLIGFWYVSYFGFQKTTNGGVNWSTVNIGTNEIINNIFFINSSKGWLAGNHGVIVSTINGGINWSNQQSGITSNIQKILFINENTGWALTSAGTVLKTTNGGNPIGIIKISDDVASDFSLSQNYPNPFNPNTIISFVIPKASYIKLELFDILGKRIRLLLDDRFGSGKYEFNINANEIPSGIYYYRLSSENYSETKKMVLIK